MCLGIIFRLNISMSNHLLWILLKQWKNFVRPLKKSEKKSESRSASLKKDLDISLKWRKRELWLFRRRIVKLLPVFLWTLPAVKKVTRKKLEIQTTPLRATPLRLTSRNSWMPSKNCLQLIFRNLRNPIYRKWPTTAYWKCLRIHFINFKLIKPRNE